MADQTDAHPSSPAAPIEESADELYESAPCGYLSTRPDGTEVDVDPGLPSALLGDPVKIGQVLTNLIGNAVKFRKRVDRAPARPSRA